MTATARAAVATGDIEEARPLVPRTAELWCAGIGMAASTALMGGFALVVNSLDAASFAQSGLGDHLGLGAGVPAEQAYEMASTLSAWFGFTLVAVLLLGAAGLLGARQRPWRRSTGWWFLAAGLVCLIGSQLILYPVAFAFFLSAGLFALRPLENRSTP